MNEIKLATVEGKFADIIWNHEPISTSKLVKLCEKDLGWKRTTTYTVLKRLCERGLFRAENGLVKALLSKPEFYAAQSEKFVEESFEGSLPAFIAAFTSRKSLSAKEIAEIQAIIDSFTKDR